MTADTGPAPLETVTSSRARETFRRSVIANRWSDGFGRYGGAGNEAKLLNGASNQAWAEVTTGASGWALSNANPRTGSWHLRMTDGVLTPVARRVFGNTLSEVFFGQAMYFEILPTVEPAPGGSKNGFFLAKFRTQANLPQVSVFVGTDGAIVVYQHGEVEYPHSSFSGTLLGRSVPIIGTGAYQHFEHYLKVGNGDGAYELRVNEVTVLNLTGIDTDYQNTGEVSQVTIGREYGGPAFGSTSNKVDMADCYVNDTVDDGSGCNTFIGDCKSGVLLVDSDTAQADFTLSSGASGYDLINDAPPDDGTYLYTASTAAESDFGLANGPANLSEILTVRPFVRAFKDDAGTCTIAPNMKSSGTKGTVSDQPITEAFAYYDSNVPFDPNTGVPWTPAGLNAALAVVERTA